MDTTWFSIRQLLEHLMAEMKPAAESKGIELKLECPSEEILMFADKYFLAQAFGNLVDNAIKFTSEGFIAIRVQPLDSGLQVEVEDTGIGMSATFLEHVFEPYTQEDSSYARAFEGTGLGLALVKRYLEVHGATVTVRSKKNKGTCFTSQFPKHIVRRTTRK